MLLRNVAAAGASAPLLPLNKAALRKVCVVGPLADSQEHMMGNYYGRWDSAAAATPLQGIREELGELPCGTGGALAACCRGSALAKAAVAAMQTS